MCPMNMSNLPLLNMLQQKMSWLSDRQTLLARNIANASTPGFKPQDLQATDFSKALQGTQGLMTTNSLHIQPRSLLSGGHHTITAPDSQSSPDGNSVVVEEQMLKVSDTQIGYAQAAGIYKKMTGMWRMALGGQ
jgi:flagellar basal-body rod protein FlgB